MMMFILFINMNHTLTTSGAAPALSVFPWWSVHIIVIGKMVEWLTSSLRFYINSCITL